MLEVTEIPAEPSAPDYVKNTLAGFVIGLLVMVGVVVMREILGSGLRREIPMNP